MTVKRIDRGGLEYAQGGLVLGSKTRGMLGRAVQHDDRDRKYPVARGVAPERWEAPILKRFFWPVKPRGPKGIHDQRKTNQCTGRSAAYVMAGEPFSHIHVEGREHVDPAKAIEEAALLYYDEAKKRDPWRHNDNLDEGSTVRAAAKGLVALGEIRRYRWATTVDDLRKGIRWMSMCVVGIDWTVDMYNPDRDGVIRPTGETDGGHAIAVDGYDDEMFHGVGAFQLPNSWGPAWGRRGYCWLPYPEMATLLKRDGEACAYSKFETDEERGH